MSSVGAGSAVPADTTNVQTIREAPEIEARRLGLMDAAREVAMKQTTLPAYQVAAMTTPETEARTLARSGMAGQQQLTDATTAASGAQTAAGQTFNAAQVQAAMNPYIQNVVNQVSDDYLARENQLAAQAVQSGNFGGGREGVGIAELQRQKANTLGGIYGQGYQSALGELQTQRALETQTGIQAGEINLNAANIAQQGRAGQLQGLMGTGGVERGVNQAALEAQRQTALQNIQEPYQRVAFVSDIQSGVPSSSQQRIAQTRAPQPSPLGQAVGTGIGAYAAFTGG